jgi:hypothetical protein
VALTPGSIAPPDRARAQAGTVAQTINRRMHRRLMAMSSRRPALLSA